jgi:hypothetical protein
VDFLRIELAAGYVKKRAMNLKLVCFLSLAILAAGCGSPSKPNSAAVDQLLGPGPAQGGPVLISGPVRRGAIPWSDGLTLRQAFVLSGYQGPSSGMRLGVYRGRQRPIYTNLEDLYHGQDLLLEPGDRIEIQPLPK